MNVELLVDELKWCYDIAFPRAIDLICDDSRGELTLINEHKVVFDSGLNQEGVEAGKAILSDERFTVLPLTEFEMMFIDAFDGARLLAMPMVRRVPKNGYREPHWLPSLVRLKADSSE